MNLKKALLIGIDDYPEVPLHGCVSDINRVAPLLHYNGDESLNFEVKTYPNIDFNAGIKCIKDLFDSEGDMALFYFSGHGMKGDDSTAIVFPQDGSCKGLPMSDIMSLVQQSKIRNKVIILDCCYSGAMGELQGCNNISILPSGVSILSACRNNESAVEVNGEGVFTSLICNALNGEAADYSGNITIGNIYSYIDRAFSAWEQRPIFKTNVSNFISIRKVQPKVELSIIRKLTTLFSSSDLEFQLDPSYEFTNTPNIRHELVEPYANKDNVEKLKALQKLESIGLVEPVDEEHMYFAAMHSKRCRLTNLGKFYWSLVDKSRL